MLISKTCSCGKQFSELPVSALFGEMGYFWNCTCQSTLFWPAHNRYPKLLALAQHPYYRNVMKRVKGADAIFVSNFVQDNDHLDANEWAFKVNRLWLDQPEARPKNHALIWEVLSVLGSEQS